MVAPRSTPFLEMQSITKRFPGVVANDDVNFTLQRGEIHTLLGENGAGKSTLMKILYGLYQADSGYILINGEEQDIKGPNDALKLGIGMVHQHFMLIPEFTVVENLILGTEPKRGGFFMDMSDAIKKVETVSEEYGLLVDPTAKVLDVSVGMQQRVEILKALMRGAEILILDEPTAVLTPQEVADLFEIMRNLKAMGKSIVFISHKLKEVTSISDRVTVIRRGKIVGSLATKETDVNELARMMVGRDVELVIQKEDAKPGEEMLSIERLKVRDGRGLHAISDVSLSVRTGEIVGIAGVDGNGQGELVEAITGMRKIESGKIILKGKEITNLSSRTIFELNVVHVPSDRHRHGLVLDFTVAENMVLRTYYAPPFSSKTVLDWKAIKEESLKLIEEYDVRTPSEDILARSLSGGNQQKVIIARELSQEPDLIVASQPTRGLDVGAIEFVHRRLVDARDAGKAVLLFSLELDEILALSDRIAVIYEGEIVGIIKRQEATEEMLGLMMAGVQRREFCEEAEGGI